jgi:MarR family transcriptional regulator, temperature-dependent positive regulator of motility
LLADGFRAWDELLHGGLEMAGYGDVRPAHFAVFRHLDPGGSRVTELAEAARMTKQSMGELVDHLERCGYVERRPDPHDRRAKIVVFTETGRRGIGVATELVAKMEADLTECMGEGRLEELAGSLEELANLLAELAPSQADSTEPP